MPLRTRCGNVIGGSAGERRTDARDAEAKEAEATTSAPIEDEKVEPRQGVDEGKHADGLQDAQMFDAARCDAPPPVDARVLPKGDDGDSSSSSSSDSEDTVDEDDAPPDAGADADASSPGNAPSPRKMGPLRQNRQRQSLTKVMRTVMFPSRRAMKTFPSRHQATETISRIPVWEMNLPCTSRTPCGHEDPVGSHPASTVAR